MSKGKRTIVSLAITVLMLVSLCLAFIFGSIALDKPLGCKLESHFNGVKVAFQNDPEQYIADRLYEFIVENATLDTINKFSEECGFEYSVALTQGRPLFGNMHKLDYKVFKYDPIVPDSESALGKADSEISEVSKKGILIKVYYSREEHLVSVEEALIAKGFFVFHERMVLTVLLLVVAIALTALSFYLLINNASALYKLCFGILFVGVLEYYALRNYGGNNSKILIRFMIIEKVVLLTTTAFYMFQMGRLHKSVKRIGKLSEYSKESRLPYPISVKPFAEDIEEVARNLETEVAERIKSERLKTELISNVSHDIKTPLTSIINFSDLIIKEPTENAAITEYATHLHSQSIRMKDMMESLIEASKASVGAIEMNMIPCNVETILEQCVVEYEEKLEKNDISLVKKPSSEELIIMADVNALSRIFDNLLTNILRYALPGSRAYVDATLDEDGVEISFKNISKEPINVSAEELKERFVRGDASRHSEGHGLGLSIVQSLMELMNGKLKLSANSDLFEARLIFPK